MSLKDPEDRPDVSSLRQHLQEALNCAESEPAKYHLREACQKVVILDERDD